ncbi:toll-like receptor 4 [Physella acuta]|uniref:toll-like receptor 4 n=1 Tax=Physella acuta TaxID=109671 RepID=UPI0027DD9F7E|nr:toll-like receptor 4 [Physella acuta]
MDTIILNTIRMVQGDSYNTLITGDAILTRKSTKYLRQICVAHVSMQRCLIFVIMDGALSSPLWDRCLKSINLNKNQIYGTKTIVYQLLNMKHIETIMIEFYNTFEPKTKSVMEIENIDQCKSGKGTRSKNSYSVGSSMLSQRGTKFVEKGIIIYMSSSLRYLDFKRLFSSLSFDLPITIVGANNLCSIDISESSGEIYTSTVKGLDNLKILILSGNHINVLSYSFFDTMPGLEALDLSRNQLPNDFMSNFGDRLFQKLTNLQQLELSFNSLNSLSSKTFLYNRNLRELFLAGNRFRQIPFNLQYTPNLRVLDLRFNDLITLTADVRYSLEKLATDNKGFNLYLEGNILSCGCHDIQFLLWMKLTIVNMDLDRNYSCIDTDGVSRYTEIITDLGAYWRQCTGESFLWFSIIMFCLMFIGFLLCFFVTKYKTYIISGLLNSFSETFLKKPSNYEIGVFIGYADRDYQFACHDLRQFIEDTLGLTTFIRDRDLSPSTDLASATVQAIDRSWRVLLVVNETFLSRDRWFLFICRAATSALTSANPKRIVVLVEHQLRHRLPAELSRVVLEDNIVVSRGNLLDYELKENLRTRLVE